MCVLSIKTFQPGLYSCAQDCRTETAAYRIRYPNLIQIPLTLRDSLIMLYKVI